MRGPGAVCCAPTTIDGSNDPPWALAKAAEKARSVSTARLSICARFMSAEDARVGVLLLGGNLWMGLGLCLR